MENQKSLSFQRVTYRKPQTDKAISLVKTVDDLKQNYIVYRVKLDPIEVSVRARDEILKSMASGQRFVQLGEYTVMVNTISSIEPLKIKNQDTIRNVEEMKRKFNEET